MATHPVFWPRESHRPRSLVGWPSGLQESDTTECFSMYSRHLCLRLVKCPGMLYFIAFHSTLLHFCVFALDRYCGFWFLLYFLADWKASGKLVLRNSISSFFPIAFAPFVPLGHILIFLAIFIFVMVAWSVNSHQLWTVNSHQHQGKTFQ